MPFTYIVRCADSTLYVGHTDDLALREQIAREHQLKQWSREKKEALIRNDRIALDWLSHRKSQAAAAFTWRDLLKRGT